MTTSSGKGETLTIRVAAMPVARSIHYLSHLSVKLLAHC